AQRPARGVVGLDAERLATREAVRVVRAVAGAPGRCVERMPGADVQIAEPGAPQRIAPGAGRAALAGRARGGADAHGPGEPRQRPGGALPHPTPLGRLGPHDAASALACRPAARLAREAGPARDAVLLRRPVGEAGRAGRL